MHITQHFRYIDTAISTQEFATLKELKQIKKATYVMLTHCNKLLLDKLVLTSSSPMSKVLQENAD